MPISWNEIKERALLFSQEWERESSEDAEAKSFWDGFFHIFGISRKRVASFEEPVKKLGDKQGFIDLFWKGILLVEHKSRGKDLDRAFTQAIDYFPGILERDLPKYVLVSDFARFRLYDLEANTQHEFPLEELHKNVNHFAFVAGYQTHTYQEQDPVNFLAAECMGKLHDLMLAVGYKDHPLEAYLVRLLFCLFSEDTGIFQRQQFREYIELRTQEDGSDLAERLTGLFHALNTPEDRRLTNLDEHLAAFPYVNGLLFSEMLPPASFDSAMRKTLLDCCALDWGKISPAIFGSLFQSIMDKNARRNFGAHYTSEENILKLIQPLFMDALWDEFKKLKSNKNKLLEFHKKLRSLTFLDPACGCGNFLVIAYRELRLLELEVLRASFSDGQKALDVHALIQLDVDQFYGIEIAEFPAQIAQVALWLTDHQMNLLVSEEFGQYFVRIPLNTSPTIVHTNALVLDWNTVIPKEKLSYIMGNPPFVGYTYQNKQQKEDMALVFAGLKTVGVLDYVTAWYVKTSEMIRDTKIRCAFVSTNSITQGEQVGILWNLLLARGMKIFFAHRTFRWTNEGRGKAAVHCVIIGFAHEDISPKWLYEYDDIKGTPHRTQVSTINPYLKNAGNIVLKKLNKPICDVSEMSKGSQPTDGGFLLFTDAEKKEFLKQEPAAKQCFRPFLGAEEFLNNIPRWCLWLKDISTEELKTLPLVFERVKSVKKLREASRKAATREWAKYPAVFTEDRQPVTKYLLIPRVSSETRYYVPIGFLTPKTIVSDACLTIPNATLYEFGVLTSLMHNAWMRSVCGRLESRYRYSVGIVYNNFPWPEKPTQKQKLRIEAAAQKVLDVRTQSIESSLANMYHPLNTSRALLKAHQALDRTVDAAYGRTNFKTEDERVAFLFELHQKYTSLFPPEPVKKIRKRGT